MGKYQKVKKIKKLNYRYMTKVKLLSIIKTMPKHGKNQKFRSS